MEIINNRYRLKELVKQEKHVMVYSAFDMRKENKLILLHLLNTEYLPKSLIDFFISRFLDIKSLTSKAIVRNYSFNTVSYIDSKLQAEPQYFFTSDYVTGTENIFDVTKEMTFRQMMDSFVELCTAVHYLHLKGFIYGALNRHSVQVIRKGEGLQVLLKDVASVQMERITHAERIEDSAYKSPQVLAGIPENEESDIYSLGVILLAMLSDNPSLKNPTRELALFAKTSTDAEARKIIPVLENILNTEKDSYSNLYELIVDINKVLQTNYSNVKKEEFEGLNLHTKLVGREEQINNILKSYEKMISFQPSKRIFFVQGTNGIGKTRFLQEIKFLFDLSKASVYSSYSLNNISADSKQMWIDLLRKLIIETDKSILEKYSQELMKYFPELLDKNYAASLSYTNEHNTKYRLLNRIAGFINESIQNHPAVMIIDNIHLADDFTIDTFNYVCTEVLENTNLSIIFSCEDNEMATNTVASEFIHNMKKRQDSEIIRLEQLDEKHTGEMIQSILSISFIPKNISRRIYRQSYGNPLFVTEIMKDLYSRQILYVSEQTGRWQIDIPEGDKNYSLLDLPNSVEHALVNQLKDLNPLSLDILKSISIFSKPVSMVTIEEFLPTSPSLEMHVEDLVKRGVLQRLIDDSAYLYDFRSKVLKNIVYEKISQEEKTAKHELAAARLEEVTDFHEVKNLDELIFHFANAKNLEKARIYYLENAKKMEVAKNTKAQIDNLKKALELTTNSGERMELYLELGALSSDTGDITVALEYLEEAERLAEKENNAKHRLDAYIKLANAHIHAYHDDQVIEYIDKAERELSLNPDEASRLEIKRFRALLLTDGNQIQEAAELFHELIAECGDQFNKIKGNAYRTLGFIYVHLGKPDEALEVYHKSVSLLEEINYTRGVLLSLNNIGAVYAEHYQDYDKAMEYHLRVKNLSEEYGIHTSEVFALINIAESHLNKHDFETAFDHFSHALTKAERYNMPQEKYVLLNLLTQVGLERNNFNDALGYFRKLKKDLKDNPNKGFDIAEYYMTSSKIYLALGNYEEADRYNQKIIEFHHEHENILKYTATVNVLINQLRLVEDSIDAFLIDQIIRLTDKITSTSIIIESLCEAIQQVAQKDEIELAQHLLTELEMYVSEDMPNILRAKYLHAKGAVSFRKAPNQTISYLEESLSLAKAVKNKELIFRIQADLGNCYFALENYYDAANYYLESSEGIKELIHQIPGEYRLTFMKGRKFSKVFSHLAKIRKWMQSGENERFDLAKLLEEVQTINELDEIRNNQVDAFISNPIFMQYISDQYMEKLSGGILHQEDLFIHLDSDVTKNFEMIGKFLAGRLLATRGFILAEEKGQELTVLSSIDGNRKLPGNLSIFNRVRSTMKPVLLSEWSKQDKVDPHFLPDDLKAVLCIPIIKDVESHSLVGETKQVLGYIYLETDKIVNNFNQHGLEKCMQLVKFLVLLLEKRQLTIAASIDKLTGALTRKSLEDALQNTLDFSRKNGNEFSIIMFDLDKFKGVNDRYGHQIGDQILREVSQVILANLDPSSLFGRYGGEEFVIILPSVKVDEAARFAEELRLTVQGQKLLGEKHEVTLSMGLATYPEHGQTVRELILKADQALYVAKENGRNNSQVWQKEFENKVKQANKLTGIISGDEIRDARNVLALVELIQLTNQVITVEDKIYHFLGRIIEIIEAEYGYILLTDGDFISHTFGRKSQEEAWVNNSTYNPDIISSVVREGRSFSTIDWEETDKINTVNGLPDWDSIIAVPISTGGRLKGVIYLSAPARLKEFGADEINVLNVYSELVANIV
ncbi:diguanylate cyclase [Ornithinibacillus californiensis]|uniref:diguanylate cyclase n=1 Tax=Ornithinibacillus californiensis TaxID=161536 RepID=UPI00064DF8BE|nr:diguanylate cyclase [Ornithinibacillus californiensis]